MNLSLLSLVLCPLLALSFIHEEGPHSFQDYSVLRFIPSSEHHLSYFRELAMNSTSLLQDGIDFWKYPSEPLEPIDVMFSPEAKETIQPKILSMDVRSKVMIDDVQKGIDRERELTGRFANSRRKGVRRNYAQFFSAYQRYPEIISTLEAIAHDSPNITSLFSIGKSFEERDLRVIKIGRRNGKPKKKVWLDAGLHAREWIAPATAMFIVHKLVTDDGKDARVNYILDNFDVYVMPLANPDGYEYTHDYNRMWRKTRSRTSTRWGFLCRGVDPNRNWDYQWRTGGSSNNPCSDIYAGETAFSEPETKAMSAFILREKPFEMYMTLHSYSQMILSPWGWTEELPKDYLELYRLSQTASQAMAKPYGTQYKYGATTRVLYIASGGSDDWAYGEAGARYSYTYELRDTGDYGFLLPPEQILPQGHEFWIGFATMLEEMR